MRLGASRFLLASLGAFALSVEASGPTPDNTKRPISVFFVGDGSGRSLGALSLPRLSALNPGLARVVFQSPSGKVLVATNRRDSKLDWTIYRDPSSGESLVVWKRTGCPDSMTHISMIYSIGEKSFGWSWDKNGSTREAQSRREKVSSWVTAQSPALAKLLREAAYAAVLSQKATLDSPDSAEYFRVVLPLVPLYSIFLSAKDTQTGPSAVLRSVGGDVSARLLGYLDENVTLDFPSHAPTKWNGELVGGRDEKLGRLRLEPKTGPESGAFKSRFVTLEWTAGSRAERFNFILYGPAEGYFGKLERKVGGDWATVVTLEGLGPIDSEGWWDQYRIGDKYEKEGTFQCVEIPPSGQAERQRRRAALLDAVRDAMARSGVPQADSEEVLFRWQRILNLPDSKESLPALAPLAEILADAPIPVFRLEADGPWAGAVRLVH